MKNRLIVSHLVALLVGALMFGSVALAASKIDVEFLPLKYFINGEQKFPPVGEQGFIYNGRTYVPLRFLAESLGYDVKWNGADSSIHINVSGAGQNSSQVIPPDIPPVSNSQKAGEVVYPGREIVPFNYQSGASANGVMIVYNGGESSWKNSRRDLVQSVKDNLGNEYDNFIFMHLGVWGDSKSFFDYVDTDDRWHYIEFPTQKQYKKFKAKIGLTEGTANTTYIITFQIFGDGKKLYEKELKAGDFLSEIDVDISNVDKLRFKMTSTGDEGSYEGIGLFNPYFIK